MERRRLKSVMIVILALADAFLLAFLVRQRVEEASVRRRAEDRLMDLFAAEGVLLPREAIPHQDPPPAVLFAQDPDPGLGAARAFLSGDLEVVHQDGAWSYHGGGASALFRADGTFSVLGLSASPEDALSFCRDRSYREPDLPPVPDGAFATAAVWKGAEVFDCTVTFSFEDGVLREVYGLLLPREGVTDPDEGPFLSASGALAAFQAAGDGVRPGARAVTDVSLCWSLRTAEAGDLLLLPAWRISTDVGDAYVECLDGTVSVP